MTTKAYIIAVAIKEQALYPYSLWFCPVLHPNSKYHPTS